MRVCVRCPVDTSPCALDFSLPVTDGRWHYVAVSVTETHVRFHVDGVDFKSKKIKCQQRESSRDGGGDDSELDDSNFKSSDSHGLLVVGATYRPVYDR